MILYMFGLQFAAYVCKKLRLSFNLGQIIYFMQFGEDDANITGNIVFRSLPNYFALISIFAFLAYL